MTTIKEANVAFVEIVQATQQNAAMSEQATAASSSLADKSARLAEVVGRFWTQ